MKLEEKQDETAIGKVLHIAPTPFFSNRGCHIRILNEMCGLRQNNTEVILCTYGLGGESTESGLDVRRIRSIPGYKKISAGFSPFKFIADILLFFKVLNIVRKERISIIHGHLHEGGLIGWAVKTVLFRRSISLVMDVQGSLSGELSSYGTFRAFPFILKLFYFIERIVSRLPDRVVCSSAASRDFLVQVCNVSESRIQLLGDVVPDRFFQQKDQRRQRELLSVPQDKKIVLYSGSLLAGKGADLLLEAMPLVLEKQDDAFFVLIGYPKEWVEEFVVQHQLGEKVLVVGEVSYQHLADWLSTADLAIDPKPSGSGEASGKILHYMAAGLATVCYPSENNRKFLGSEAFYAPGSSAEALAAAIETALLDADRREIYGAASRKKAQLEYSLEAVGKHLLKLYGQLRQ